MTTNQEVIDTFYRGTGSKSAANLACIETQDGRVLIGHGHAVLAHVGPGRTVTMFEGWKGHSQTTSQHYNATKRTFEDGPEGSHFDEGIGVDRFSEAKPECSDVLSANIPT